MSNKNATAQCAVAQQYQRQWEIRGFRCGVGQAFTFETLGAFSISGQHIDNNYKSTPCNVTEQRRPQYHRLSVVRIHIFTPIDTLQKYWITWMLFENKNIAILFKYVGEKHDAKNYVWGNLSYCSRVNRWRKVVWIFQDIKQYLAVHDEWRYEQKT